MSVRVGFGFGLPGEPWENEMCFLLSWVWSGPLERWGAVAARGCLAARWVSPEGVAHRN